MTPRLDIHRTTDGGVEPVPLKPGTNKIKVVPGRQFKLVDPDNQLTAEQLRVLQVDTDLIIENIPLEGGETASVVLEGYYQVCSASDPCDVSVGGEEGNAVLLADVNTKALGALSDGAYVLHDQSYQAPASPILEDFPIRPVLYGVGGAAVLGLALAGGGGGGGDGAPPIGDIPLALKSATSFNNRFPTIAGTAQPGTEIQLRIDTDGDLRENVTYTTTADAAGNWSVNLQTATAASGALPAAGLSDSNSLAVTAILNGVQNSLPLTTLTFDNVPPAKAEVTSVADDGIITGAEKVAGVPVSGTAEANGTVEIKLGTHTVLVPVNDKGEWTTTLAAADLPATDGDYKMTVTALDAAGNRAPATEIPVILNTSGSKPAIGRIAGDDVINAAEAAAPIAVGGTAAPGSTLKVSLGTATQDVTVGADGKWSASLTLPAGLADGKHNVTVESATGTSNREITLDRTPPPGATGVAIDDGPVVSFQESRDGIVVSGAAEANANVRVSIGGGGTQTATAGGNGQWRVQFTREELNVPEPGNPPRATNVSVIVEDAAENRSAPVTTPLTLQPQAEITPPTITTLSDGDTISAEEARDGFSVSGRALAGATVNVRWNGVEKTATVGADGQWNVSFTAGEMPNVAAGSSASHPLTATATLNGVTSPAATQAITVQGAAQAPTPTTIADIAGDNEIDTSEAAGAITISGTAAPNARINIDYGGLATGTGSATASGTGAWSTTFTVAPGATDKDYTIKVTATPTTGAASEATATVELDRADDDSPAPAPAPGVPTPTPGVPAPVPPPADPTTPPDSAAPPTATPPSTPTTPTPTPTTPATPTAPAPGTPAAAPAADGDSPAGGTPAPGGGSAAPTAPGASAPPNAATAGSSGSGDTTDTPTPATTPPPGATPEPAAAPTPPTATPPAPAAGTGGANTALKSLTLAELLSDSSSTPSTSSPAPTPTPTPAAPTTVSSSTTLDSLVGSQPWEQQHSPLG